MINLVAILVSRLNLPGVKLNLYEIQFLKDCIVNKAFVFENLSNVINTIITDKVLTIEDFFKIIMVVIQNYKQFETPATIMIDLSNIIKFTLDILVQSIPGEQIINVPVQSLIDYSLTLLVTNINNLKINTSWLDSLKCCC